MVAVAGVGTLHAFNSLFAVAILLGTLKAAYSAVQIALMIAAVRGAVKMASNVRRAGCAVIRHADATKQKLISASGQRNWRKCGAGRKTTCIAREVATDARKLLGLQPCESPPPTDEARGESRAIDRAPKKSILRRK
jgi:hypothetical protein